MKRSWLAVLAMLPLTLLASGGGWFQGTLDNAQAAAKAQNKMLVLKFYADW